MTQAIYTHDILRLAMSLPSDIALTAPAGTATKRARLCGSEITATLCMDNAATITAIDFKARACAFGQASAAILKHFALGKNKANIEHAQDALKQWLTQAEDLPAHMDGFLTLEPARMHNARHAAMLLPFDALICAFEDAHSKLANSV